MCNAIRLMPLRIALSLAALSGAACAGDPPRALDFSTVGVYGTCFDFCDFSCFKVHAFGQPGHVEAMAKRIGDAHAAGKLNLVGLYCVDRRQPAGRVEELFAGVDRVLEAVDPRKVHAWFLGEENVYWDNGLETLNALYDHVKSRTGVPVYQWYSLPMVHHPGQKADGWIMDPYGMRREPFRKHVMKYLVLGKPLVNCQHGTPAGRFAGAIPEVHAATREQIEVCREFNVPMFFYCVDNRLGSPQLWLRGDEPELVEVRRWVLAEIDKIRATDASQLPLPSADSSPGRPIAVAGDAQHRFEFEESFADLRGHCFIDDASIAGFLMLRWDSARGALHVRAKEGTRDAAHLTYHFTSEFAMSQIEASVSGVVAAGARADVSLSFDGRHFERGAAAGKAGPFVLRAHSGTGGKQFWVRASAQVGQAAGEPVVFEALRVECRVRPPENRVIVLAPGPGGHAAYTDDFQTQKHLHLAHVENPEHLEWERGLVGTHGVRGRANEVTVNQKFTCAKPLSKLRLAVDLYAHRSLGSYNAIGLSLDGEQPLIAATTRDREQPGAKIKGRYNGVLEVDAALDERFAGVTEFWVHLRMVNTSGKPTRRSNAIRSYTLQAEAARPGDDVGHLQGPKGSAPKSTNFEPKAP